MRKIKYYYPCINVSFLKEYIERWSKGRKDPKFDDFVHSYQENVNKNPNWKRIFPIKPASPRSKLKKIKM